jgi:purine-binding chemotaxis protein CheW
MSDALLRFADSVAPGIGPAPAPAAAGERHLVTFALQGEEFGIPVAQVREVIRVGEITRVPQAPPHVRGVTNLRGRILPVVDLRTRLGLPAAEPTPLARILVVELGDRVLGLLVDAVLQVAKVPLDVITAPPDEVRTADADYLSGVARWSGRLIILLELDKALLLHE